MKAFIQKIFSYLKALFLRLRVVLTLQFGRDKVDDSSDDSGEDESNDEGRHVTSGKD